MRIRWISRRSWWNARSFRHWGKRWGHSRELRGLREWAHQGIFNAPIRVIRVIRGYVPLHLQPRLNTVQRPAVNDGIRGNVPAIRVEPGITVLVCENPSRSLQDQAGGGHVPDRQVERPVG